MGQEAGLAVSKLMQQLLRSREANDWCGAVATTAAGLAGRFQYGSSQPAASDAGCPALLWGLLLPTEAHHSTCCTHLSGRRPSAGRSDPSLQPEKAATVCLSQPSHWRWLEQACGQGHLLGPFQPRSCSLSSSALLSPCSMEVSKAVHTPSSNLSPKTHCCRPRCCRRAALTFLAGNWQAQRTARKNMKRAIAALTVFVGAAVSVQHNSKQASVGYSCSTHPSAHIKCHHHSLFSSALLSPCSTDLTMEGGLRLAW